MKVPGFVGKLTWLIDDKGRTASLDRSVENHLESDLVFRDKQIAEAAKTVKLCLEGGDATKALSVCDEMLILRPGHPLFESLRLETENREREARLEYTRQVSDELKDIPDLDRRVNHLRQALGRYPTESQLVELLRNAVSRRDFVKALTAQARASESNGNYLDALERWHAVRECHPQMAKLDSEIHRLEQLQSRVTGSSRKAEFLHDISRLMCAGNFTRAVDQCRNALLEFPGESELVALEKIAIRKASQAAEAQKLIADGLRLLDDRETDEALKAFRSACTLDPNNPQIRHLVGLALLQKVRLVLKTDWRAGELLFEEVRELIPEHPDLKAVAKAIERQRLDGEGEITPDPVPDSPPIHRHTEADFGPPQPPAELVEPSFLRSRTAFHKKLLAVGFSVLLLLASGTLWLTFSARKSFDSAKTIVPPAVLTALDVSASPEGAQISVDGKVMARSSLHTLMSPGPHSVSVSSAGYLPQTLHVNLESQPSALSVTLQPAPMTLHVMTDQPTGSVWLDGEPKGNIGVDGVGISGIKPGVHKITVRGPEAEVTTDFTFRPGSVPVPTSLPSRSPAVLFVGSTAEKSYVECNCGPATLKIGGVVQSVGRNGLEMNLPEGEHQAEFSIMGGKKLMLRGSRGPLATVAVYWGQRSSGQPVAPSVEALFREANTMISNRRYQAALAKVNQILSIDPADDRAPILQRRLERLMAIDP